MGYASRLANALGECTAAGADVVSMSLGGGRQSRVEKRAFDQAERDGVLSIAAAGNDGDNRTSYPAGYDSVVSVAAIDAEMAIADFSQQNKDVELAAPGVGVLSTIPWIDDSSLSVGDQTFDAGHIDGSGRTSGITGPLADGGLCDTPGSWAGMVVLCQRGVITFAEKFSTS